MEGASEYTGRTVEEAILQAERETGTSRSELDYEIVTAGRAGVFGIGAEPARIRVRTRAAAPEVGYAPAEQSLANVQTRDVEEYLPSEAEDEEDGVPVESLEDGTSIDEYESDGDDVEVLGATASPSAQNGREGGAELAEEGARVLRELLQCMGFDAEVTVRSTHDPIMLVITGDNLGVLIGRRGDNLSALQFMVNLLLSKNRRQWPRVVIDAENYRARREESLRTLAGRIAYRVRRNGRPFTLEAMPASDRRVIHLTLRDDEEVETYSIGEGAARRVVIAPKHVARASSYSQG